MARRHRHGADCLASHVDWRIQLGSPSRLRRNFLRRPCLRATNLFRVEKAGRSSDQTHGRDWPNAHVGIVASSQWRSHRDTFSCFRIAGLSRVLSRLAGDGYRDGRRCGRSFRPRRLLAAISFRRADREPVALGGTCRLGRIRGCFPDHGDLPKSAGDARHCISSGRIGRDE